MYGARSSLVVSIVLKLKKEVRKLVYAVSGLFAIHKFFCSGSNSLVNEFLERSNLREAQEHLEIVRVLIRPFLMLDRELLARWFAEGVNHGFWREWNQRGQQILSCL